MTFKRNWFIYFALFLYLAAVMLIMILAVTQLQKDLAYPYLTQMLLIIGFFGVLMLIQILSYIITRPWVQRIFAPMKKAGIWIEAVMVVFVLITGLLLRLYFIRTYPVKLESDYKLYYDVATMLVKGTLATEANNEYIALFPNTFGYSYILSVVMRIFGTAPEVCLYFNACVSVLTALICYYIGKLLIGKLSGMAALIISCFWPSQIIFSNINGTEAVFTFMLYGSALLSVYTVKKYDGSDSQCAIPVILHFLIGILLALTSAVRPMSLVFFIALILCMISINHKLQYKNINDVPLGTIFLSKGWLRALIIIMGYMLCTPFINAGISNAIQNEIADSGALGYSLLVGVNTESSGMYSEDIMSFLYETYKNTKSVNAAHQACLTKAIEAVKANPVGTLELLAKKFYLSWLDDNYATTTNIIIMNNQGLLTQDNERIFNRLARWNNVYYLLMVFLSAVGVIYLFKRDNNGQLFAVFFVGAVILHMLVEVQNRYHYYLLQNFAILAAVGIGFIYNGYRQHSKAAETVIEHTQKISQNASPISEDDNKEKGTSNLITIDVLKAIEEGHIVITATRAYEDEALLKNKDEK